jgi:effector-binding domain-containing protein
MAEETPQYKVIQSIGEIEVRDYHSFITANVTVKADSYEQAANNGFSYLANYIFGGNVSKESLAMTSPVTVQKSEKIKMTTPVLISKEKDYTVSFIMPSGYTLENLPTPQSSNISFTTVPKRRLAAIRFSGFFNQDSINKNIKSLELFVKKEKLITKGEYIVAGYNGPFTLWFLQRNEVMIEIEY